MRWREKPKTTSRSLWSRKFAWWPVPLDDTRETVWLEFYWRRDYGGRWQRRSTKPVRQPRKDR